MATVADHCSRWGVRVATGLRRAWRSGSGSGLGLGLGFGLGCTVMSHVMTTLWLKRRKGGRAKFLLGGGGVATGCWSSSRPARAVSLRHHRSCTSHQRRSPDIGAPCWHLLCCLRWRCTFMIETRARVISSGVIHVFARHLERHPFIYYCANGRLLQTVSSCRPIP